MRVGEENDIFRCEGKEEVRSKRMLEVGGRSGIRFAGELGVLPCLNR